MTQPEKEPWHTKSEIQIGHILATISVAVSAVFYIAHIEQRVAVVESQVSNQKEADVRMRAALDKINDKLDRLIERTQK